MAIEQQWTIDDLECPKCFKRRAVNFLAKTRAEAIRIGKDLQSEPCNLCEMPEQNKRVRLTGVIVEESILEYNQKVQEQLSKKSDHIKLAWAEINSLHSSKPLINFRLSGFEDLGAGYSGIYGSFPKAFIMLNASNQIVYLN